MGEKVAIGPAGLVSLKEIAIRVARITDVTKKLTIDYAATMDAYAKEREALQSQCPHPKTQQIADTEHEGFVLSVEQCELCDAYVDKGKKIGVYDASCEDGE